MPGSDGGMALIKQEQEFYHRNGFPALALALFKTRQTPKELSRVPVEYAERAVRWLNAQGYEKIGTDGTSKGSEMALVARPYSGRSPAWSCGFPPILSVRGCPAAARIKRRRPEFAPCSEEQA